MMPIVNGLGDEFGDELNVYELDAAQPAIATLQQQYGLRGHPSFAVLAPDGQVSAGFFGPQYKQTLREAIVVVLQNDFQIPRLKPTVISYPTLCKPTPA